MDLILDSEINPVLLSSFIGALSLFGKNLGKIKEINITGIDVNMIIVYKYDLILIIIVDADFLTHNIRNEAEKALDMFYSSYLAEINNGVEVSVFNGFKKILYMQIQDYLEILKEKEREKKVGDLGFLTEAVEKMKQGSQWI